MAIVNIEVKNALEVRGPDTNSVTRAGQVEVAAKGVDGQGVVRGDELGRVGG